MRGNFIVLKFLHFIIIKYAKFFNSWEYKFLTLVNCFFFQLFICIKVNAYSHFLVLFYILVLTTDIHIFSADINVLLVCFSNRLIKNYTESLRCTRNITSNSGLKTTTKS